MKKIGQISVLILFFYFGAFRLQPVYAATRTWDGGGGADPNWSNNLNWSNDTVPIAGDTVVFDNTSSNNSTWDASGPASIAVLTVNSNYSGTLTLGRDVTLTDNFTYNGANFAHGNHKITFAGSGAIWTTGSVTYYDIEVNKNAESNLTVTGTGTIAHNLTLTGSSTSQLSTGTLNVGGDITLTNFKGGSATININGTGTQTITGSGTDCVGQLPAVTINKASGNLTLSGNISVRNNWTFTSVGSGSLITTGSTVTFCDFGASGGAGYTVTGTHTLNNVSFINNNTYVNGWFIGNNTITVNGDLNIKGTGFVKLGNSGVNSTLEVKGNITVTNTGVLPAATSTGATTLLIDGTGTQTLTGSGTEGQGAIPGVTINKASGNLTLASVITIGYAWTFTSMGTGSLITSGSTVAFYDNLGTGYAVTGTHTLNNVTFANNNTYVSGWSIGNNTITINGDLAIKGAYFVKLSNAGANSTLAVKGNITITNTATIPAATSAGATTILINGTVDQTLTGSGTEGQGAIPAVTINKASGNLTLSSVITVGNAWTFTSMGTGTLNTSGSTVAFYDSNGSGYAITGTHTLNNVTFANNNTFSAGYSVGTTGQTLTVNGTLAIKGSNYVRFGASSGSTTIAAKGDVTVTNTATIPAGQTMGSGATLLLNGTADQTVTGSGTECGGPLPPITINKATSGNMTLSGLISVASNWTYTAVAGSFNTSGSTVAFCDSNGSGFSVLGTQTLNNVTFSNNNTWVAGWSIGAGSQTITVNGTLAIKGTNYVRIGTNSGTNTIAAKGDITVTNTATIPAGQSQGSSTGITINGTGDQTITGNAVDCGGPLPPVTINKAVSGNLTLSGIISVTTGWTYTALVGSFTTTGSTVAFCDTNGTGVTITGSHTLNNATFSNTNTFVSGHGLASGTTLTVAGTLAVKGSTYVRFGGSGAISAQGDITITNTATIPVGQTKSAITISINGTGNQVYTGSGTLDQGVLGNVTINKASGNLTLASVISLAGTLTYTSIGGGGSFISTGSTVALTCDPAGSGGGSNGTYSLNNVTLNNSFNNACQISLTGSLTVNGTLTDSGSFYVRYSGTGAISAKGDITITNTALIPSGSNQNSSIVVTINGTVDQTVTGNAVECGGTFASVTVNKASGNLTLANTISFVGTWTHTSVGTGSLITTGSTLADCNNDVNPAIITGTFSLNNLTINNSSATSMSFTVSNTVTVAGTLAIKGISRAGIGTGTINAQGDITITNTGTDTTNGGSGGTININGTGTQTLTGSGVADQGPIPNVTINKSTGTLNLVSTITVTKAWTWTAGSLNAGTSTIYFDPTTSDGFTPGNGTYNNINFSPAAVSSPFLGGNVTLSGTFTKGGNASSTISTSSGSNYSVTTANLTITSGSFLAQNSTITISGNYTNSATFTKGGSTLVFNGAGISTIEPGASQINNFTVSTASKSLKFSIANSTVISGTLTLNGADCNTQVILDSTDGSSQFTINATGTKAVSYVRVKNSIATTGITASSSWDSGNNSGWTITNNTCTGTSATATAYSFQRKTWYDGSRLWKSFNANSEIEFWYSTDGGSNWTENVTARIAVNTSDFSIQANASYAFIAYTNGFDIETRAASSYPGVGFSWGGATIVYDGSSGTTDYYQYPTITADSNNKIWIQATAYQSGSISGQQLAAAGDDGADVAGDNNFHTVGHPDETSPWSGGSCASCMATGGKNKVGVSGTAITTGYRWASVAVPKGITVTSASFDLKNQWNGNYGTNMKTTVKGALTGNISTFSNSNLPRNVTATSATATWNSASEAIATGTFYSATTSNKPPAITAIIQEIVNQSTWSSGNAIAITINDNGSGKDWWWQPYSYESGVANSAKLTINYAGYRILATQSTGSNDISAWNTSSVINSSTNSNQYGVIVPRTSGNVQSVFIDNAAIKNKNYTSGAWDSSPTSIATGVTGITNNMSAVSDSSGNIHLIYLDSSNHTVYQEYTSSWQTAVTLDSNAGNSYATISLNTATGDLYALWIRGNHIYYKKGATPYASGNWDAGATDWQTTGTNTYVSGNFSGSGRIFTEWTVGSGSPYAVGWAAVTFIANQTPGAPTVLYANELASGAQFGAINPMALGSHAPVFSAVFNDTDVGDVAGKYEIIVYKEPTCTTVSWDSGSGGTSMPSCTQGNRCSDLNYGGSSIPFNGRKYFWKIRFWDQADQAGTFSACGDTFTILGPNNQMRHGNYFFRQAKRVFTW